MKNKKLLTSGIAVLATVGVLFGGTFAWQSISQTALNEVSASVNPGGRLHDDFNDVTGTVTIADSEIKPMAYDKDVYVENFTKYADNGVQVFARVRLDEYMELGQNAGKLDADGRKDTSNTAVSLVAGATLDDKSTWTTHLFGTETDTTNPFHQYWNWDMGGSTVYMPTFNTNKDSLEADINGSFKGNFEDHTDYALGDTVNKYAIYDVDAAEEGQKEVDEIVQAKLSANDIINAADDTALNGKLDTIASWNTHIDVQPEEHTAKSTLNATIMSMEDWQQLDDADKIGNYWVYDADGWAYWASPINPETATGLLLNGINRNETIINQDWYYAINVVAQFVTGDDLGSREDGTGFFDLNEGSEPSTDAMVLLSTIGVQVQSTASDAAELVTALELGGVVKLTDDITVENQLTVSRNTVLNLNGHTIATEQNIYDDSVENGSWSLLSVQDGATVVINGGTFQARANDSYAVDVRDGSKVVINGGNFVGNVSAVYVKEGEAVIAGGTFSIQQLSENNDYRFLLNCLDENYQDGTAKITVTGGTFENFDPSNCLAEGEGTNFVAASYSSNETAEGSGIYNVTKNTLTSATTGE